MGFDIKARAPSYSMAVKPLRLLATGFVINICSFSFRSQEGDPSINTIILLQKMMSELYKCCGEYTVHGVFIPSRNDKPSVTSKLYL